MFLSGQSSDAVKIWPSNGEKYAWFRVIPEPVDIYVKASDQVGICPTGYVPIRTSEECENAAEYLGEDDLSVEVWDHFDINIPSGCWFFYDELRFNTDPGNWNFNGNNGHVIVLCKQENEISEEPTIDETVQITTSEPGQSCDHACGAIEKECVEDMLIHQTAEEVASWALSVGVSCSYIDDRCDMGESPIFNWRHHENENLCTFCSNPNVAGWQNGNRCGAKYSIRERICPCTTEPIDASESMGSYSYISSSYSSSSDSMGSSMGSSSVSMGSSMGSSSVSMGSSMGSSGDSMGSSMGSSSMEDIYVKASDQVGICPTGYVPIRTSEE